jgi:MFS family permease
LNIKAKEMKVDIRDLALRFILGGTAVAACFLFLQLLPWKAFAGIFAAFPAVMVAAVIMAGHFENSERAADIALGASAGMLGGVVCVLVASLSMQHLNQWGLSLAIALAAWFMSSLMFIHLIQSFIEKRKAGKGRGTEP